MRGNGWTRRRVVTVLTMAGTLGAAAPAAAAPVELEVLSSRADLVSGGDALVRVGLEDARDAQRLRVRLGDRDVSGQFARRANGQVEALLTGIPDAPVTLTATAGRNGARLPLVGHPNGGPLISGPQLQPWVCQEGAVDAQCNQPARYELLARTEDGFVPYDPGSPPAGVQETTTTEGERVPFVVRVETGYQDRDQYKIATLYDPARPWEPWAPQRAWNRRMVLTHGGSCGTDRRAGGAPDVLNEELLGKGFLVSSTALNNLGHNCNPVVIAESELMVRERIVEQYGPVRATLGTGCSGGAIAQLMVAHAYPGFYDGITVQCTFADLFTTGKQAISGHLFRRLFTPGQPGSRPTGPAEWPLVSSGTPLAPAQADDTLFDTAFWPAIDGSGGCKGLPADVQRWSPETPDGVRCGVLDHNVNVLGTGKTGHVGIPFDNVGVQYGLRALQQGLLTPQQFVEINRDIGGLDPLTLEHRAERTEGELPAIRNAYRAGYLAVGNTLPDTPIIEGRGSNEATAHVTYPTKVLDARLRRVAGTTASHVVWEGPVPLIGSTTFANRMVLAMDRWVAQVQADRRDVPQAQKVREGRPADLTARCETADGQSTPPEACPHVRYYQAPTQVAGEGPEVDIMKCQLKPVDPADYPPTMLPAQVEQLRAVFPTGVCDWSRPGVGETDTVPWLTFQDGPGGRPLGAAPRSAPFTVDGTAPGRATDGPGQGQGQGAPASAPSTGRTPTRRPARVRATLTRRVLAGRRLRVACRLTGARLRTCRVDVLVRRGARTRTLRTLTLRPGRSATIRTGTARRLVLRARLTATDGRRFTVTRTLVRRR